MSSLGSPSTLFLAKKGVYEIDRSLRFNDNDSPYFDFTPSGAGSNQMTFSFWIKRANLVDGVIFSSGAVNARGHIYFSSNQLYVQPFNSTGASASCSTNMLFRDSSAWYHIVISLNNTTYSDMSSTINIYVNGVAVTFTTSNNNNPSGGNRFNDSQAKHIGQFRPQSGSFFDGYLAEFNFIDGQVLDQSSFGETDAITGQWNPKKYTGGYGSNGFYLNFSDNSGTTATTLGKDNSGNGNNFTPNNFVTGDAVKDSPTNNFCTLNILNSQNTTLSEGNLKATISNASGNRTTVATMGSKSGKWYYEILYNSQTVDALCVGFGDETYNALQGNNKLFEDHSPSVGYYGASNGFIYYNTSRTEYSTDFTTGDIIGVAADFDNNQIYFYKNGTVHPNANPFSYTFSDTFFIPAMGNLTSGGNQTFTANFGQDSTFAGAKTAQGNTDANGKGDFYYSVPSGFKALCSANLPNPTILLPNKHFNTLLWSGNGAASRAITGLDFQPDWVWLKSRTNTDYHQAHDAVRGIPAGVLFVNVDAAEDSNYPLDSFDNNGFTTSADASDQQNTNGQNYVAWNWNAGDTDGKTYTVKVVSDSGNKYRFDDFGTSAVTLDLAEGGTYIFDQSDSSNAGHPLRFSTTSNGTHGGGSEYTTGVTTAGTPGSSGAYTQIVVAASAPTLYYYCTQHSGMGGQVNTNSTLGSSNFEGNTQATVKVNATAGFSIISWTARGNSSGTYDTFGHGLGVRPNWLILKSRNQNGNWNVYNSNFSSANNKILQLSNTIAETTSSNYWGADNTTPSSTLINVNQGNYANSASHTFIMYAFSEVAGYSKFGQYIGNGSTDGTFVYTGFRPAWVLLKRTDTSKNWILHDSKRDGFNVTNEILYPNTSESETNNAVDIDIVSNGFKLRSSGAAHNASGGTYLYFCFAESPFKNARAR